MHDIISTKRRSRWQLFAAPLFLLLAAIGWSAFWFYAASQVDQKFDGWKQREAKSGRTYDCASKSVAGFPFRMEVTCADPVVTLVSQTPDQAASGVKLKAQLKSILVLAQIYDPTKIIADFTGPAIVAAGGEPASYAANWSVGRASVAGLPLVPQRVAFVFDNPSLDRINGGAQLPLFRANHLELHTRLAEGSVSDNPVIDTAFELSSGTVQGLHPILAVPFDADIRAQLRGLKNLAPKPWPERFREIQAAGGRLDFTQSRVQQGETIAVAAGSLSITPSGFLDGELQMTVAGLDKVVPLLGIDRLLDEGVSQSAVDRVAPGVKADDVNKVIGALDRLVPGLGNVARKNANAGVVAGINLLGQPSTLEGRKALALPLRFTEGTVYLGPLKVAQTPKLF
ncbi:MAG: DUF2125 domain-containing protein [Rhizobiales bacterium]|nr:DUF2125 domain-containing protein [Hyphomicrobiales bacterium]